MYAIIEIQGAQVKVEKDYRFTVNRFKEQDQKTIKVEKVMFGSDGSNCFIGDPYVKGAYVECEILRDKRGPKVIAYKYRDRKSSQSKKGHRQELTELVVKKIHLG